jgi:trigger factor
MQVIETLSEGLKRELKIIVPASELDSRLATRLEEIKDRVNIKGFRPGKVPVEHLRRLFGRSTMAEVLQSVLAETTRQTLRDRGERAAVQPEIDLPEDQAEAEKVLNGESDLAYLMKYEVLPKVDRRVKGVKIERLTVTISDEDVTEEPAACRDRADIHAERRSGGERRPGRASYVGKTDDVARRRQRRGRHDAARFGQFIPG